MNRKRAKSLADLEEFRDFAPAKQTLGDIIDDAALNYPDREALIDDQVRLTFSQVHDEANRLAKGLIKLGIQKGDRVAILMQNTPQWPITAFAIAKVGAIIVPCNTRYTKGELQYVLNKSEADTLVMTPDFPEAKTSFTELLSELAPELSSSEPGKLDLSQLPFIRRAIIHGSAHKGYYTLEYVKEIGQDIDDEILRIRQSQVRPDDACIMIFTSGTTGFPKGCVLRHSPWITSARTVEKLWKISGQDKVLLPVTYLTTYGFEMGLVCPFSWSIPVCMQRVFDPGKMLELIEKEQITILLVVPTMITALFEHPNFAKTDFSSLRTGNIGGTLCPPEMLLRVRSSKKGWGMDCSGMMSLWGMTETHGTGTTCTFDDPDDKAAYTVGRMSPVVEYRVVDPTTGEEKGPGEEGELTVKGDCVFTEYFGEPEQTAEAIRDGWFHTKDLVIVDEDGYFKISGRASDMIIVGGANVYPKEIENKLRDHPKVVDVSVFGVPDEKYGEVPAVHIIRKPNVSIEEAEIIEYCKGRMAKYKLPKYVDFVEEFPVNPGGKVQKFKQSKAMIEKLGL